MYNIALGGQDCGKLLDLLENIFGYPETKASKDFEASLQPHSLLDPEEEPEAEAIRVTNKPGPPGSTGAEGTTESLAHRSLKCPASGSFDTPSGKGKAFRRLSSTPIEEAVALVVIS